MHGSSAICFAGLQKAQNGLRAKNAMGRNDDGFAVFDVRPETLQPVSTGTA